MNLPEIRQLAQTFSVAELDAMARHMLEEHPEEIVEDPRLSSRFNSIVKAKTVRGLMDKGSDIQAAVRELGRTMRSTVGTQDKR
jgi:hypothetical protein